ncbi:MAG: hypothetical protein ACTSPQ_12445 [Candidatus Helarchaeota archaeon]
MTQDQKRIDDVNEIINAARRLGVEIDEKKAINWLNEIASLQDHEGDLLIDESSGIFGHKIQLIDFGIEELERFRKIANIVGIPDIEGSVETAISLSGSAAQGKVQRYPGDLDYFERVNIIADTKEEACKIISKVMRKKALERLSSPIYQLIEVKWGTFKSNFKKNGKLLKAGSPICWDADEVKQGFMWVEDENGKKVKIDWEYGEQDPGWCKLDWLLAEPDKGRVINVSNMLDVTWEAPDGNIVPLDGQLDPYFQEVYLESNSIPLFTKIKDYLTPKKLDEYVEALEREVVKYTMKEHENYGKVAKRLYNIFRLKGAHKEAMYLRELFDEPASALYQVWSMIDTIDDAGAPDCSIDKNIVANQISDLILKVVKICEGEEEEKIVSALMKLRDDVTGFRDISDEEWSKMISESRYHVIKLVNEYFYTRLKVIPQIIDYIEELKKKYNN